MIIESIAQCDFLANFSLNNQNKIALFSIAKLFTTLVQFLACIIDANVFLIGKFIIT